jgi:hypothetical protein
MIRFDFIGRKAEHAYPRHQYQAHKLLRCRYLEEQRNQKSGVPESLRNYFFQIFIGERQ